MVPQISPNQKIIHMFSFILAMKPQNGLLRTTIILGRRGPSPPRDGDRSHTTCIPPGSRAALGKCFSTSTESSERKDRLSSPAQSVPGHFLHFQRSLKWRYGECAFGNLLTTFVPFLCLGHKFQVTLTGVCRQTLAILKLLLQ